MAILDFSKFGITNEDINTLDYILGYDFGHGEVTVAYKRLTGENLSRIEVEDVAINADNDKKVYSALARTNNQWRTIVGRDGELQKLHDSELFLCFKRKPQLLEAGEKYPGKSITCKELVQIFTKTLFSNIIEYNNVRNAYDFSGKGLLVVGCPSSPEWLNNGMDLIYQQIILHAVADLGLDLRVTIMPESRASLLKVYNRNMADKKNDKSISDFINNGIIVFDFGSSTLDSTSISLTSNISPIELSIPLGASLLEQKVMELSKNRSHWKNTELYNRDLAELYVRKAKEDFYSTTNPYTILKLRKGKWGEIPLLLCEKQDSSCPTEYHQIEMNALVREEQVCYNTKMDGRVEGTWYDLARLFIKHTKTQWMNETKEHDFEGLVLITGGASGMGFVQKIIENEYPNAYIHVDKDPSVCVSQGLVIATDIDLKAYRLISEINENIHKLLLSDISRFKSLAVSRITDFIYDILSQALIEWKDNGDNVTINQLVTNLVEKFSDTYGNELNTIYKNSMQDYINDDGEGGLKKRIATVVEGTFNSLYPHTEKKLIDRVLSEADWDTLNDNVLSINMDKSVLLSGLDLTNSFKMFFFTISLIPLLVLRGLIGMLDSILGANLSKKMDKYFLGEANNILNKDEREDYYIRMMKRENETKSSIQKSIEKSFLKKDSQEYKYLVNFMQSQISPIVENSIDQATIYF